MKHTRRSRVCFIPEEHATARSKWVYVRSTFNITKFAKRVLFQVENAIKSVLLLPSLLRPAVLLTTTRDPRSPPVKCRLLSGSSSLVSSPSTLSLRVPRLSPSTPAPSKFYLKYQKQSVLFRTTKYNIWDKIISDYLSNAKYHKYKDLDRYGFLISYGDCTFKTMTK